MSSYFIVSAVIVTMPIQYFTCNSAPRHQCTTITRADYATASTLLYKIVTPIPVQILGVDPTPPIVCANKAIMSSFLLYPELTNE
jgi:hypothetical protein